MQVIEIDQKLLLYKIIWDDDFFYGTNKNIFHELIYWIYKNCFVVYIQDIITIKKRFFNFKREL